MKRAVFLHFVGVLLFALLFSGAISCYVAGQQLLDSSIENMRHTIWTVDDALDYEADLQKQLVRIKTFSNDVNRRLTIINQEGEVCADTDVSHIYELENHGGRTEVEDAWKKGFGYESRYSETLKRNTLYVAEQSRYDDYVVRMSVPFNGWLDFASRLLPGFLLVFCLVFVISLVLASRFADSVSRPLGEISQQMLSQKGRFTEWEFKTYQYPELNIISKTMEKVAQELKDYTNRLEFEKKVRQEFFSNVSHELKTPITSIRGFAELLEGGFVPEEEKRQEFLQRMIKETNHITGLINDILMISRLETKEAEPAFSQVRVSILLEDILKSLEPIADENGVELISECQPVLWYGSEIHLREVFTNLISNGIKYNKPGGCVWVTVEAKPGELWIQVQDTGVGISDEDKGRIFERFYRVDKGRSRKQGGTGLGLSIVKHIVEFCNGTIELSTKVDEGSTFLVRLPIEVKNKMC
ncbi:MAG: sensor histidine kinase [Acetivibrio ethanolgignens]